MKTINLTRGLVAIVDDEDFEEMSKYHWVAATGGYAIRNDRIEGGERTAYKAVFMHRVLMNAPHGMDIDHINGNPSDNRRKNLRVCSRSQNLQNRRRFSINKAGFKGVSFRKRSQTFRAQLMVNGKYLSIGGFPTAELAFEAYKAMARLHHGEFARFD